MCFPLIDFRGYQLLFKENPAGFLRTIPYLFNVKDYLEAKKLKRFGSFQLSEANSDSNLLCKSYKSNYLDKLSRNQFYYLAQILSLCKKQKISISLISTPVHRSVSIDWFLQKSIDSLAKSNGISYHNFRNLNLNDSMFQDKFHLNTRGSKFFTNQNILELIQHDGD